MYLSKVNMVPIKNLFFILLLAVAVSGCATTKANEGVDLEKTLVEADTLAASGAWDEALLKYDVLYRDDPTDLSNKMNFRRARREAAHVHYGRGEEHLKNGNHEGALLEYQASLLLDPSLKKAEGRMKKTKKAIDSMYQYGKGREFLTAGKKREAKRAFKKAVALNPDNTAARVELDRAKQREGLVMDGFELDLKSTKSITLEFKDVGVKKVFSVISKLSGINFVFDSEVRDSRASIILRDAPFTEAIELILMTNKLKRKVVSENTIIIYPDTPQKARQYEEMLIKIFYLTNIDAKKTVNLLRTMIKARDIYVHADLNAIVVRAKPEAIELAEKILEATDLADAEVMLIVDVMEVSRDKARNLGFEWPSKAEFKLPHKATSAVGAVTGITLDQIDDLGRGDLFMTTLFSGSVNLSAEDLDANLLANPRIRVMNNKKASIHIGERVPIITATTNNGVTTENVQYLDVGLKLDVEPVIRPNDEIDLKIGLEVSSLGTKTTTISGSVVYQIGTRNVKTVLRLGDGETQIIGGLITEEERTTKVKVPGLGDIPIIGRLFSNEDTSREKTDILLSITPHIVRRLDVPDDDESSIWSGREDTPSTSGFLAGSAIPRGVPELPYMVPPEEGDGSIPPPPPPPGLLPDMPEGFDEGFFP